MKVHLVREDDGRLVAMSHAGGVCDLCLAERAGVKVHPGEDLILCQGLEEPCGRVQYPEENFPPCRFCSDKATGHHPTPFVEEWMGR